MREICFGVVFIALSLIDFTISEPQQPQKEQSFSHFSQPYNDGHGTRISTVGHTADGVVSRLLNELYSQERKNVARCYREDIPTINIKLYYEALCPGCEHFIKTGLYPTYRKLGKYLNGGLFPYGNTITNSTLDPDGKYHFVCKALLS